MAMDEMGIQYFHGVNNDTKTNLLYHFSYFISLITGIFDNLALKSNDLLGINNPEKSRVSLFAKRGDDFLKKIKEKNPDLRNLIHNYVHFINLIYLFRESIIHREGFDSLVFHYNSKDGKWYANFLKISQVHINHIRLCRDEESDYDMITKWGVYKVDNDCFLDMYHFSIEALKMLTVFVDKYLERLNYQSFIERQMRKDDDDTRALLEFKQFHLGL
jgi:hypothetical protein